MGNAEANKNIIAYLVSTGTPGRAASGVRAAGSKTNSGNLSCHAADNTRCSAVDFSAVAGGVDNEALGNIFKAFAPVYHLMNELIYAGPQVDFNIRNGIKVPKYAQADHHNHVHASVDTGTLLPIKGWTPDAGFKDTGLSAGAVALDDKAQDVKGFIEEKARRVIYVALGALFLTVGIIVIAFDIGKPIGGAAARVISPVSKLAKVIPFSRSKSA